MPFFRVSFSPIFSRTGYQKKANFLEQVVKTCQKRKFCYNGLFCSPIFVFLSILFTDFSRTGYYLKAKIYSIIPSTGYFVLKCSVVLFSNCLFLCRYLVVGPFSHCRKQDFPSNFYFVGTSPYKSRSSTPPGAHLNIDWKGGPQRPSKEAPKGGGGGRWSPGAHHFESLEPWSPDDSHGNFLEF